MFFTQQIENYYRPTLNHWKHGNFLRKIATSWGWAVPSSGQARLSKIKLQVVYTKPKEINLRWSPIFLKIEVVIYFLKNSGRFHFLKIEIIFHLQKIWGCLPFSKNLRLSSIFLNVEVVFHFLKIWGRLPFPKIWGCLPFS